MHILISTWVTDSRTRPPTVRERWHAELDVPSLAGACSVPVFAMDEHSGQAYLETVPAFERSTMPLLELVVRGYSLARFGLPYAWRPYLSLWDRSDLAISFREDRPFAMPRLRVCVLRHDQQLEMNVSGAAGATHARMAPLPAMAEAQDPVGLVLREVLALAEQDGGVL